MSNYEGIYAGPSGRKVISIRTNVRLYRSLRKPSDLQKPTHSFYAERFGVDSVHTIKGSSRVESAQLDPEAAYIQITYVEPYFDAWERRTRLTAFERNFNIKCSPAYEVDANNNIVPRPLVSDMNQLRPDPNDVGDFVGGAERPVASQPALSADGTSAANNGAPEDDSDEPEPTDISLFSAENLVATDVYSDEAYHQFVKSWTPAETMVLRPVHLVVSVLRLRANQVPFCKHGTISYPLKDACRARNLPWYDFERLPFVVLVQSRRDGTSAEAMVNMQTILRAKYFMERTMECKYNPRQTRPFYRFVGEQWMPFSNENLAALQRRLSEPDRPSTPAGLRVVLASDIHARADKVLRFNEFCNWLDSGFTMADELWKSFRLSRSGEGADTTEAGQDDLWEVIESFVVGQAVDAAADRHNGGQHERRTDDDDESDADEIDVTMRHVLNCAVANGWLLPAPVDGDNVDSTGEPSSVLLRCCEELEMLGREFGNDEAGTLCSSFRAEMVALQVTLDHILEHQRDAPEPVIICTDSLSALAALREGPSAQRSARGAAIWKQLLELTAGDRTVTLQWVPSHCGIPENESADALANEAATLAQEDVMLDVDTIYRAAVRTARDRAARDRPTYPDPDRKAATGWYRELMGARWPPPLTNMDRTTAVDVHQIRTGRWSGSAQFLHSIGRNPSADCPQCRNLDCPAARCPLCGEQADTPRHILLTCPGLMGVRLRIPAVGNILPTVEEVRRGDTVAALVAAFRALQS
ncbi:Dedicator of cytokinesis protein 7 [Amphibalanus amphitrite]|uniref:Dedicator of cytokinesis protein 7 n=1 Tax=Amphibalanus amphitrite TaxID=1232801 RepID=A0A6A4VX00_AMPAM|nr:Dedicator of cytokinesis protein 7 [Amphibalanus amphitrite]